MERDGLLTVEANRELHLTDKGREIAVAVMRKHRLAERLLVDVIGMDVAEIHDEACRWEHVISENVERHLMDVLDHPHRSPYGNPIPGLDKISADSEDLSIYPRLTEIDLGDDPAIVTLRQVGEIAQTDQDLVDSLIANEVGPGARVSVKENSGIISLRSLGGEWITIPNDMAHAFYVEPVKR